MRRAAERRTLLLTTALLAAPLLAACGEGGRGAAGGDGGGSAAGGDTADATADTGEDPGRAAGRTSAQEVAFAAAGGLLLRRDGDGARPLLALDSAAAPSGVPVVPASWRPAPGSTFRIGATSFRHVAPSPDGRWVAWEAGGTHDLVGVVPAGGGPLTVLDFYFDSSAEELLWAPGGRYLAARHLPPSGREEVRVYDAAAGARLRAPWEEACRPQDGCRVTGAGWTGRATLRVTTSDGGEGRYEVDVSRLPARPSDGG